MSPASEANTGEWRSALTDSALRPDSTAIAGGSTTACSRSAAALRRCSSVSAPSEEMDDGTCILTEQTSRVPGHLPVAAATLE